MLSEVNLMRRSGDREIGRKRIGVLANSKGIVVAMDSRDGMITLTAKEAFTLIGNIRTALFDWNKITGRKIDEPACH